MSDHPSGCCCPHHRASNVPVASLLWLLLLIAAAVVAYKAELVNGALTSFTSVLVSIASLLAVGWAVGQVAGEVRLRRLYDRPGVPAATSVVRALAPVVPLRAIEATRPTWTMPALIDLDALQERQLVEPRNGEKAPPPRP